jgi:RNA polymerase sigma-70 factor (ECF subfamily)
MQRGRKNDGSLHRDVETEGLVFEQPDPARRDLVRALGDALAALKPEDRAAVLLADVEGWSTKEIASALDMSPGQARTRLSRSRKRLRELMGPSWESSTIVDTNSGASGSED